MKDRKSSFLIVICLIFALILRGQTIPYKLYTPHDGLPQSQVLCIFQDSRGYIWVGTKMGLASYNGVNFQKLSTTDSLPSASVDQIQEDGKGNIWFSCGNYICKYDGKTVSFDTVANRIKVIDGLFYMDKSHTAWAINQSDSLLYSTKDFKQWSCVSEKDPCLKGKKWERLVYDTLFDRLILLHKNNNYAYKTAKLTPFPSQFSYTFANPNTEYFNTGDSIFKIQADKAVFIKKAKLAERTSIVCRSNGTLCFVGVWKDKFYTLNPQNQIDSFDLNGLETTLLFQDRDKNLWIGTEQGLVRVYLDGFRNFDKTKLSGIWSIVEDTEGAMWFGSYYKKSLKRYANGKIDSIKFDYKLRPDLAKGVFQDFYFGGGRDKKGNLYFPMSWGVMKYDGQQFSSISKGLSMNVYLDNARNSLISSTEKGFKLVNLATGKEKYYGESKGLVPTNWIFSATKDLKGNYWLATGYGVSYFDFAKDSIVKNYKRQSKNFPFFGTYTVFCDAKGTLWVGSMQGLLRYDEQKDSFVLVASDIIKSVVNALVSYKNDYLVIGAGDGMYFLDLNAFYTEGGKISVRCFNQHNGYTGIEPNQNALYVDSKDNVWVAASDIVTKITPSELDMTLKHLTPYITSINDERILYEAYQHVIPLKYGESTAKIFFEAIGFDRPYTTEFSYKIDNGKWTPWKSDEFAVLSDLSSGTYTFHVRTRPSGTVSNAEIKETAIAFKVSIPLYREPFFPILALITALSVGFGIWWYVQKQRQREATAALQREADAEKQAQLELLNIEMSHRVRNNLRVMQAIMSMQERRTANEEIKKALKEGGNRIEAMSLLHNHLIVQKGKEFLTMKPYIEELWEKVSLSYANESLICRIKIPDTLILPEIFGRHIAIIISELLTNSIKHAFENQPNPHIDVNLSEENALIVLLYRDNGQGLPDNWDSKSHNSLGMKLIHGVAEQFKGQITFFNKDGFGCRIEFPQK